jgi:hypothetical protein
MKRHIPAHWISPFIGELNKKRVSSSLLSVNARGTKEASVILIVVWLQTNALNEKKSTPNLHHN